MTRQANLFADERDSAELTTFNAILQCQNREQSNIAIAK